MQTYEIFLTNLCTRNCSFCDIPKGSFSSSCSDVLNFIDYVKAHENKLSKFNINFFGGEPLLQCESIYRVCDEFKDYPHCKFVMTTNGDLIGHLDKSRLPANFSLGVSAYDIFTDVGKYVKIKDTLQPMSIAFRFTFDESSIDRLDEFKSICKLNRLPYYVAFSHARKSWTSISIEKMEASLKAFYLNELDEFYKSCSFDPPSSILLQFTRFVLLLFDKDIQEVFCTTEPKAVFYRGLNIGPCIRLDGIRQLYCPSRCQDCRYKMCCKKGCIAEYLSNDIDEKLCLVNKTAFESIEELFDKHLNSSRLTKILSYAIRNLL